MTNKIDTLEQFALQALQKGQAVLEKGVGFANEQLPLYVQEFLQWEFWYHAISTGIFAIASAIAGYVTYRLVKFARSIDPQCIECSTLFVYLMSVFLGVGCLLVGSEAIGHGFQSVKVKVAPRVYLVDHVIDCARDSGKN